MSAMVDLGIERELLGTLLWDKTSTLYGKCAPLVEAEDFYPEMHREIWRSLGRLASASTEVDTFAVLTDMRNHGIGGAEVQAHLMELMSTPGVAQASAEAAAVRVHRVAQLRSVLEVSVRVQDMLDKREEYVSDDDLLTAVAGQAVALLEVTDSDLGIKPKGYMSWSELWQHYPGERPQWLVEHLLLPEDVWMLLGAEGGGKSFFSRQFCLSLAAGVHPFLHEPHEPVSSFHVDLENAEAMLAYETRLIGTQVARLGHWDEGRARVLTRPKGIDLRRGKDQRELEAMVGDCGCRFLTVGSLYKAFKQHDDSWQAAAGDVRDFLDSLRERYHLAILLEHHMPKAPSSSADRPASPYGSLIWQQWPSLGHIIERIGDNCYQLHVFRGGRMAEARRIPVALFRGGELPWSPIWDEEEMWFRAWEERRPGKNRKTRRPVA